MSLAPSGWSRAALAALVAAGSACFVEAIGEGSGSGGATGTATSAETTSAGGGTVSSTASAGGSGGGAGGSGGCDQGCRPTLSDACAGATPFDLPPDSSFVVSGTTVGATDDVHVTGINGLSCASGGLDVWIALRATQPGAIALRLLPGDVPEWGSNLEKAVLQVRTGCDAAEAGEALICHETVVPAQGEARTAFFSRPGEVYYVGVDGKGAAAQGPFDLEIAHTWCGNGNIDLLEQCDSGAAPTPTCAGCLSTATDPEPCGADDADTVSLWGATMPRCYVWETGQGNQNFFEARQLCVEMGGDLASLETMPEKAAFDALFMLSDAWVGLENFEKDFANLYDWLTGPPYGGPWIPGDPNNGENKPRCAFMVWDMVAVANVAEDVTCETDTQAFVCELRGANP